MWKFILLIAIILLVIHIVKRALSKPADTQSDSSAANHGNHKSADNPAENMVQCCTCQIHLPRSEAFMVEGQFYCSHAHIKRN